jgi:hypothetical protein
MRFFQWRLGTKSWQRVLDDSSKHEMIEESEGLLVVSVMVYHDLHQCDGKTSEVM